MKNMQPTPNRSRQILAWLCSIAVLIIGAGQAYGLSDKAILNAMTSEMERSVEALSQEEQPLYYLSYEITETVNQRMSADRGRLLAKGDSKSTILSIDLRVGDPDFDNTHVLPSDNRPAFTRPRPFPYPISLGNEGAIRQDLWFATDSEYRTQAAEYQNLKQAEKLETSEREKIPDFAASSPLSLIHI